MANEKPAPELPPVDPAKLDDAARRMIGKSKPPGGWPWQQPNGKKEGDGK